MIERSSISNNASDVGAQCSPRHACPLKGALLMQVHDLPQGAPVLALAGEFSVGKTHAKPCTLCMAFLR